VVEAALVFICVRIGLWLLPHRTLRRLVNLYAGRACADNDGSSNERVRRVARAVKLVARRLPGTTTCLVEALSANAMLQRRGHAAELCFGVRRSGSGSKTTFDAHAWIEHHGIVVLGELENLTDYAVMK
jgi:hypothetical protein